MDDFVIAVNKLFDKMGCVSEDDRDIAISIEQFHTAKGRLFSMMSPRESSLNLAPEFNMKVGAAVTDDNPNTFWEWLNSFSYRYYEYARELDAFAALRRPPSQGRQSPEQPPKKARD
jgi:hypothetical protein